ncbi:BRO family protein [Chondrinema litorale]|uniref:BRO family protein n=1 Tax=Chondrinema litorale TaxID=2994555 RepID=UPI002543142C|nr:BRO family protein [Chondrinema litorale]UZR96566.1 BRO family protein [Chondrinema litorale]
MNEIKLFDDKEIRAALIDGELYYAVVDVIEVLAESEKPSKYWSALKARDKKKSGFELSTICRQLKMESKKDGKLYPTECADKEALLRIIQSIPSPKAEPFKLWLAKVGSQVIDEKTSKRLVIHRKLKETQDLLFDNVKERGVDEEGFKRVLKAGDKSLFGGEDINKKYRIDEHEDADDYMHNVLLSGKTFGTELTNLNVQKNNLQGEDAIKKDHEHNNKDIRDVIKGNGYLPEDIEPEEDIKKINKKLEDKDQKKLD